MLVERSKLQRLMAMESSKVAKMPAGKEMTQSASKKKSPVPEEILLDDDDDADEKETTDDSLKKRDHVDKSANKEKPEFGTNEKNVADKKPTEDRSEDPEEILLADDEDDEVTIDNEVVIDGDATNVNHNQSNDKVTIDNEVVIDGDATSIEVVIDGDITDVNQLQQLKRKHEGEEVESKRMRKTIQG